MQGNSNGVKFDTWIFLVGPSHDSHPSMYNLIFIRLLVLIDSIEQDDQKTSISDAGALVFDWSLRLERISTDCQRRTNNGHQDHEVELVR